ncbi:MAG: 6,7-dimethyl-8-ribityllumazine synthase [Gammaproteobacteria bacterium]|nr:6,7-dimethyl-8-ribityllumazine synthase [Gammaproteobacteria bacterium]
MRATQHAIRLAIVVSEFNSTVTEALLKGALAQAKTHHIAEKNMVVFKVPGAVEIPLMAQQIAKRSSVDAIVCLGAVIQGETNHYDYVCDIVTQGCLRVMLDCEIPVIFGVLTTQTDEQAEARAGGRMGNKGAEAVDAAMQMIQNLHRLD